MLWLRVIHDRQGARPWPLAPSIARAMADVLLASGFASRSANERFTCAADNDGICPQRCVLAERLAVDPLLTLWCVGMAAIGPQRRVLHTADDVVHWFAAHALENLHGTIWFVGNSTAAGKAGDELPSAGRVVARAAALAHLSATVARARDDRATKSRRVSRLPELATHAARLWIGIAWHERLFDDARSWREATLRVPPSSSLARLSEHLGVPQADPLPDGWPDACGCVQQAWDRLAAANWVVADDDVAATAAVIHGERLGREWTASTEAIDGSTAADSLYELVARLRRLTALETRFEATVEQAKLTAMAEFAAGAGHEINNPLAVVSGRAQLLLAGERDPQRRRELALIGAQAMRIHEMIADLLLFARPHQPVLAECDLSVLVAQVLEPLRAEALEGDVQLVLHAPSSPAEVHADATQISVAIAALVRNALEALVGGGRIEVSVGWHGPLAGREAEIVVADNGPGISDEARRHLFDPYYSGRAAGRGLGLGLSKCWRIMNGHGGRIEVTSARGAGACFRLLLPAAPSGAAAANYHAVSSSDA